MKHLWLLLVFVLSACRAPASAPPPSTLEAVRVAYPPALSSWLVALHACAARQPGMGLVTDEIAEGEVDLAAADLTLWLGALPPDGFASQVGWETIDVIVNLANPVAELTTDDLRRLFDGAVTTWGQLGGEAVPVTVWQYSPESALRRAIEAALEASPQPAQSVATLLAPDPQAMLDGVAESPGALGYVPHSWLSNPAAQSVSVLGLESTLAERLRQPVLVLSSREPEGAGRALLICLQAGQP